MTFLSKKSITCLIIYTLFNGNEESSKCYKNCSILAEFHLEWFIFLVLLADIFVLNCWSAMHFVLHPQKDENREVERYQLFLGSGSSGSLLDKIGYEPRSGRFILWTLTTVKDYLLWEKAEGYYKKE